jgi:hypothetical protein
VARHYTELLRLLISNYGVKLIFESSYFTNISENYTLLKYYYDEKIKGDVMDGNAEAGNE